MMNPTGHNLVFFKLFIFWPFILTECYYLSCSTTKKYSYSTSLSADTRSFRRLSAPPRSIFKALGPLFATKSDFVAHSNKVSLNSDQPIVFAGVKFGEPISGALSKLAISEPTPIQKAAIAPLMTGLTCILHAQTGSGKTLAYLLPLLKRLLDIDGKLIPVPLQGLIIVPTKELAVQVAADIATLLGDHGDTAVHLCLTSSRRGLDGIEAPIVVGTPFKLLDAFRSSSKSSLSAFSFIVLDEVDRLLNALGRYATAEEKANNEKTPLELLLSLLLDSRPKKPDSVPGEGLQVVAASATVGRPMRRELYRILNGGEIFGDVPVLRPAAIDSEAGDDDEAGPQSCTTRKVGIPTTIRHIAMLTQDDSRELNSKLVVAKEKWVGPFKDAKRGLLFVPRAEDVRQVLGILRFWGIVEAQNLQQSLGIEADRDTLQGGGKSKTSNDIITPSDGSDNLSKSAKLIAQAARTRIGSAARLEDRATGGTSSTNKNGRDLFVVPVSGTRGLHVQDVEYVFILSPPRTMDEYLHMAGRTGRSGNKASGGTVVSLVNFEELKRLKSWETPLGIEFEVKYQ